MPERHIAAFISDKFKNVKKCNLLCKVDVFVTGKNSKHFVCYRHHPFKREMLNIYCLVRGQQMKLYAKFWYEDLTKRIHFEKRITCECIYVHFTS